MLVLPSARLRRKGQAMVEYTLLVAGVAVACALAVSVLGDKTADTLSIMAAIMPGAEASDNSPLTAANVIPFKNNGSSLVLDTANLVSSAGVDRYAGLLVRAAALPWSWMLRRREPLQFGERRG